MTYSQKFYIHCIKRPIGFFGALVALILLSPIFICTIVALFFANKNGWKGIFFTQERPGKDGKLFKVIKFKSMTDEKDENGELLPDGVRLTKAGKFVRNTSIDELPQLINVLKGDMAFIGPRPLYKNFLLVYSDEHKRRHEVTPGITGWAQVNGRNSCTYSKKFAYDVWYVDHISLWLDIKIFFMTIKNVFLKEDIGNGNDDTMMLDDLGFTERLKAMGLNEM